MTGVDIRRSFRKPNPAGTELAPKIRRRKQDYCRENHRRRTTAQKKRNVLTTVTQSMGKTLHMNNTRSKPGDPDEVLTENL